MVPALPEQLEVEPEDTPPSWIAGTPANQAVRPPTEAVEVDWAGKAVVVTAAQAPDADTAPLSPVSQGLVVTDEDDVETSPVSGLLGTLRRLREPRAVVELRPKASPVIVWGVTTTGVPHPEVATALLTSPR